MREEVDEQRDEQRRDRARRSRANARPARPARPAPRRRAPAAPAVIAARTTNSHSTPVAVGLVDHGPDQERDRHDARPASAARGPRRGRARAGSPSVRSVRKIAPWASEQQPACRGRRAARTGCSRSKKFPTYSWSRVDRHARGRCSPTRRPTAAPRRRCRPPSHHSQPSRQRCVSCLPQNSNDDPAHDQREEDQRTAPGRSRRTASRTTRGKAANVAPPAVISQTSLPSQTGPIVWIARAGRRRRGRARAAASRRRSRSPRARSSRSRGSR